MKKNPVTITDKRRGKFLIAGHVGIGHVHSHSSFVQDDSAGFALVAALMRDALNADTRIRKVSGDLGTGMITVETYGGGSGASYTRRGLTPFEIDLLSRVAEEDGIYTQRLAIKAFGRMYGQGAAETPAALQGAIALAVLNTFEFHAPDLVSATPQDYPGRIDRMAAMTVELNGIPVSLLLNINGSEGGIGPDEDNEGNTAIGSKGALMERFGMAQLPTLIVESKAFIPKLAADIDAPTFLFRAQDGIDNIKAVNALAGAAAELGIPHMVLTDALPQIQGSLESATRNFADQIIGLAVELKSAGFSSDKVRIIADMAKLISEDAGGISFMSNTLHDEVRSAGITAGNAAVVSLLVPASYNNHWKIPVLEQEDVENYKRILMLAIEKM